MSESKRVVPQCVEFPDSLGHATKKENKREKGKQIAPSFRFTIPLPESNDETYSEFDYAQLVKSAEKKRRKEQHRVDDENATNGLDPYDDDDHDKLMDMAKRFEAKYGNATAGRKRHKYDDYVDLGAGYDENDSFIDNTDAYDEIVPGEVTTAYGGFYINSGPLEFKPADGNSPVNSRLNNNNNNNEDESSEDSEDDDEDEGSQVLKRMEKRSLSTSEDDDDDDNVGDPPPKKHKSEENGEKKSNHDSVIKKKKKLPGEHSNQPCEDVDAMNSRKNTTPADREILDLECSSEDQEERKRAKYDSIKPKIKKFDKGDKKFDIKKFVKKSHPSNGLDVKRIDLKKLDGKDSNIDDAIESVVNAGRVAADDESSRDTVESVKSFMESEGDEADKEEIPLPEQLPDDIKDLINKLKAHAEKHKEVKGKFFDEFSNATLLALDEKLRKLNSPTARKLTYGHLAHFLPCSKAALVNRAKKLYLQVAEKNIKVPLQRLKVIIDGVMPTVIERYGKECQKVAEAKGLEGAPADGDSSDVENVEKSKIPRKKFPWSTETKKLVYEIASARRSYFKICQPKKESIETFVDSFMESNVLTLWPSGWMRLTTLLKYANPEPVEKRKLKKSRDATVPNSLSTGVISNTTSKPEAPPPPSASVANVTIPIVTQETAKSPSNIPENPINLAIVAQSGKSSDTIVDRKSSKHREKNNASPVTMLGQQESANSKSMAKISVVPTSQLMAPKTVKSITEKFNPMDLTSSSLSITPVSDYQKTIKVPCESKKDVISITPYNEPTIVKDSVVITPTGTLPSSRTESVSSTKHRNPQESLEVTSEKRIEERVDSDVHKTEKEKKRERWSDERHRSHDSKKRRKEHSQHQQSASRKSEIPTIVSSIVSPRSSLSKEEREQRQIEETMAATNFLSQIINDDSPRLMNEKRKESSISVDDGGITNVIQSSDHDTDVQMVMRSLKELQELQEMKYSPSRSPVSGSQKPSKSSHQYVSYPDDYPRLYNIKDDKLRVPKEETPW